MAYVFFNFLNNFKNQNIILKKLFNNSIGKKKGNVSLRMWVEGEANPIGTCNDNLRAAPGTVPILQLGFHSFPSNVAFPHLKPIQLTDDQQNDVPTSKEIKQLNILINSDPLQRLTEQDKTMLWKYKEWLRENSKPRALVKILLCVQWSNPNDVREIYRLLSIWSPISPVDALQLLDAQFANRKVREFAVKSLDNLKDSELKDYLLQLVQALKYEPNHFSALACLFSFLPSLLFFLSSLPFPSSCHLLPPSSFPFLPSPSFPFPSPLHFLPG